MSSHYQDLLVDELKLRQAKNPRYSLRAFSKLLGTSPSHLSLLMRGRKPLTPKLAHKFIDKLDLPPTEAAHFLERLNPRIGNLRAQAVKEERPLDDGQFNLISDWHYFAVLSLARTRGAKADPNWVAKRLGIDPALARASIGTLETLGLVKRSGGSLLRTAEPLATTHDVPSDLIRKYHRRTLETAMAKLETVPVEKRSYSAITFPCDLKGLPRVKELIENFKRRICEELETRQSEEVYTFSMQLFPLTEIQQK